MTTSSPSSSSRLGLIVGGRFRFVRYIASGSCGAVYFGADTINGEEVAVKLESFEFEHELLLNESNIYKILEGGKGVLCIRWYGRERDYDILVMDLLGPTLGDLFCLCSSHFTIKTVLMLANQMIDRLEYIHTKNFIHRDLKPENFLMGSGKHCNQLYLADFGLAKQYRNILTLRHDPCENSDLCGTSRFASINAHSKEQSRRDDMESLGYVLMYMIRGNLPWQGLEILPKPQKYENIREKKLSTSVEDLCKGYPPEFSIYLNYCRGLRYEETPDYQYLRWLFHNLFSRKLNYKYDNMYDWTLLNLKPTVSIAGSKSQIEVKKEQGVSNSEPGSQNEEGKTNLKIQDDNSTSSPSKSKHTGQLRIINAIINGPSTMPALRPKRWN